MFRTFAPVLLGLLITASYALYEMAGQPSIRLPAMLHLLLGGLLLVFGRSRRLRGTYAALSVILFTSALTFAGGRFGLLLNSMPSIEPLAQMPWVVLAGSVVLAAIAIWQAIRTHDRAQKGARQQPQNATPTRLDVRPASLRLRRPEDRRVSRRQKTLDVDGGGL